MSEMLGKTSYVENLIMTRLIDMFIIGAPKSATTSLKEYLGGCDGVVANDFVEMTYFVNEEEYNNEVDIWDTYYSGKDLHNKKIIAKNVSLMYSKEALQKLYKYNPDMKLVLVLRNPVDMIYSLYWYEKRKGREKSESFSDAIEAEKPFIHAADHNGVRNLKKYIASGEYQRCINDIYDVFPKEQLKVVIFEDLKQNTAEVCSSLLIWLGMPPTTVMAIDKVHNAAAVARFDWIARYASSRGGVIKRLGRLLLSNKTRKIIRQAVGRLNEKNQRPPEMPRDMRIYLENYYSLANQQLGQLIGRMPPW